MFSKILLPTDGSSASTAAALKGIQFAQILGAELVGVFVVPELKYPICIESTPPAYLTKQEYEASMQTAGNTFLNEIQKAAIVAGIKFSGKVVFDNAVALGIVKVAQEDGCDLIFMGSHGQTGWHQVLLGSVTSKVVAISPLPVLVYRSPITKEYEVQPTATVP